MKTFRLSTRVTFDSAHQLPNHDGKCANLHGHTYTVEVGIKGNTLWPEGPKEGMLLDLAVLREKVREQTDKLDHTVLNNTVMAKLPPTAEVIAEFLFDRLKEGTLAYLLEYVRVWETQNSYAEVRSE